MLRITVAGKSAVTVHLLIEGRLVGPWVAELQAAVLSAGSPAKRIHLDLATVHFADTAGLDLLHKLLEQGVIVQAVSPFLRELLNQS
jgi:anti-anti-sigma regulatory factor